MAQLIVRKLDDDLKEGIKRRARRHGRSTEEEVREILRNAIKSEGQPVGLGTELAAIFHGIGIDEEIPELRGYPVEPIELDP